PSDCAEWPPGGSPPAPAITRTQTAPETTRPPEAGRAAPAPDATRRRPIAGAPVAPPPAADEALAAAKTAAAACATVEALADAVAAFEGCALKGGARNTVFIDGSATGDLLVIGEAPGRDEDRIGKPFVGRAGQLLDRMLAAIGRDRARDTLITNVVFWRPPGNRTPTAVETAVCKPFVERLVEILRPKAIVLAGGAPTQAMLGVSGIMRARGGWREIRVGDVTVPTLPMFHPAFLLRQPAQKRLAWTDLLALDAKLRDG
ncbi:MAG: uracil-DNA glycosylase, partial [Pseudomonadota bacterium]